MQVKKLDTDIYCLEGSRSSNIYFLDLKKKMIIDTGHPDEIEKNLSIFKESGLSLENTDYIISTHTHADHVGANAYLKKLNSKIRIMGSKNTPVYQKKRNSLNLFKEMEDDFTKFDIDVFVEDGLEIDLGGDILRCYECKGHTIDSLVFFLENKKYLFTGDSVYSKVITQLDYYQNVLKSLSELNDSLIKINKIDPVVIFTGHGAQIDNPSENIEYCLKKLKRFQNDNELILINNLVPTAEFYIYKNPGCTKDQLVSTMYKNMVDFKNEDFLTSFDPDRFSKVTEKIFALMKMLNMVKEENGILKLTHKLNNYIG